ncbi:hypothetical protein PGSY75_0506500, partial [Plasmodium gaboni]
MTVNLIKKHNDIPQKNNRSNNISLKDKGNDLHLRRRKEETCISSFVKKNIKDVRHTKDTHITNNKLTNTKIADKINHNISKPNIINVNRKNGSDDIMKKGNNYSSSFQTRRNNINNIKNITNDISNNIKNNIVIHNSDYIKNNQASSRRYNINSKDQINNDLIKKKKLIVDDEKENLSDIIKEGNQLRNEQDQKNKYNNVDNNKNNYQDKTIYIVDEDEKKEENFFKNNYKKNESLNINHMKRDDINTYSVIKGLSSKQTNNTFTQGANVRFIKKSCNEKIKNKNNNINMECHQVISKYSKMENKKGDNYSDKKKIQDKNKDTNKDTNIDTNKDTNKDKNKNIYEEIKNNSNHIYYNIKKSTICKEKKPNKTYISSINNINDNQNIVNNMKTHKNEPCDQISNSHINIIINKNINDTSFECIDNNMNLNENFINNSFIEEGKNIFCRSNENNIIFDNDINKEIDNKKDYNYKNDTYMYSKSVEKEYNCKNKISININKSEETLNEIKDKLLNTFDETINNTSNKKNDNNVLNINHKEVRKGLTFEQMRRKSYENVFSSEININHDING